MSRRFWLAFVHSLIAIVVVLSLIAQPGIHKGPGSSGPSPTATNLPGGSSTADKGGITDIACGSSLKLTFKERIKNADCGPNFDYAELLKWAIARRNAVAATLKCAASCPVQTIVDRSFRPECKHGVATVVLDTEIYCTKPTALPTPGLTLPPTTSSVSETTGTAPLAPFHPDGTYEDTTLISMCPQLLIYTYREKIDSCANRTTMTYDRYINRAIEEAKRYGAAVTCTALPPLTSCTKLTPPMVVWTSWDCVNKEVVVQVAFVVCNT